MDRQLKADLRRLIQDAAQKIDRASFNQEPNYVAALFGKLHNETVLGADGSYIRICCSASDDRGPSSAERRTGIDIGLVVEWKSDQDHTVKKAVLLQAKKDLNELTASERKRLEEQCNQMRSLTQSFAVLDCASIGSLMPSVHDPLDVPPWWSANTAIPLDEYIADQVLACKRGDWSNEVVALALRADRRIVFETTAPIPTEEPTRRPRRQPRL